MFRRRKGLYKGFFIGFNNEKNIFYELIYQFFFHILFIFSQQVNPDKYRGLVTGLRLIVAEEGARAVWKGWLPTFFGYSAQGAFKYGLYEVFKDAYANMLGKENFEKYKGLVWCAASASAEFFADIALCPLEMVKVKVQTSPKGTFPIAFGQAWSQMNAQRAETGFPYRSLIPLWSRQIPYTVAKFYFFEKVSFEMNIIEIFMR
jgi:solute carrier family 25 phosphate transporter 3